MSEQSNDHLLDENISRLLSTRPESPRPSAESEQQMLGALLAKQQSLYARKETTMDLAPTAPLTRQRTYALAAALLAVAAAVAIAYLANQALQPDPTRFSDAPQVAKTVSAEQVRREQLADGTVVIARGGAQYRIDADRQLTLEKGDLYVIVAKSDQPFVVHTKDGRVTARGTRFAVSANDETIAAVAQGRVELASDAGKIELRTGQQGTLTASRRPTRQPAPRLSYLVNWAREQLAQEDLLVEKTDTKSGLIAMDPWGQEVRLTLRKYHVDVYIEDGIARTTIDQTFFNHNPWNTEGTFYFPLPPEASVSRLAMYVAGRLNEGGMVERSYGQQVYYDIRYQWRDPALLEMMEGNVFKMRIFPLEGRQEKRVFLSYTQTLPELYGTLGYWFPMDHSHNVARQLSINVRVKNGAGMYDPRSGTHELEAVTEGNDLFLRYEAKDAKPDQDLLLSLVSGAEATRAKVSTARQDGHRFLFARIRPELSGTVAHRPRQWIVLNDISASRTAIEAEAQQYIVDRLVQEADDSDTIAVIDVNTQAKARTDGFLSMSQARKADFSLKTSAKNDRSVRLKSRLLGATNLEAGLQAAARLVARQGADNPHFLYLGDGVATDGQTEIAALVRKIRDGATFVGIGVGKKVEARFLQAAADATGGMYAVINPDEDIDWRVFDLLAALNTPRITSLQVDLRAAGRGTLETIAYPSSRVLADGETLQVVARYGADQPSHLVLRGLLGNQTWERTYELDRQDADAGFVPRLWAKRHIDELLKSGVEFKDEIVALSKQYYVVTPYTSLIVLEDDAMYKQYNVERGRKDHWALYPAPKKIEVVKEPVDWNRWNWWGGGWQGEDAKVKAKANPKSIKEIVDSVQFRINAPFYYWQPQRHANGRFALYHLLDSDADPTQLLTKLFVAASGQQPGHPKASTGITTGDSTSGAAKKPGEPQPAMQLTEDLSSLLLTRTYAVADKKLTSTTGYFYSHWETRGGRFNLLGDVNGTLLPGPRYELKSGKLASYGRLATGGFRYTAGLDLLALYSNFETSSRSPMSRYRGWRVNDRASMSELSLAQLPGDTTVITNDIALPVMSGFHRELRQRMNRIDRDVRTFNQQFGYWSDWGWGNGWNELDLTKSHSARWYEGLEGFDEGDGEQVSDLLTETLGDVDFLTLATLGPSVETEKTIMPPAVAIVAGDYEVPLTAQFAFYGQTMKALPGGCAILAADFLVPHRAKLQAQDDADVEQIQIVNMALAGAEAAAARLEDSGAFWSWQGWNYRPHLQTFQPPAVQAYPNYNWSFDLTRYAEGLYSTQLDALDEVVKEYGLTPAAGSISADARQRIDAARAAIRPVRIRFPASDSEIVAASDDRFEVRRTTEMSLHERIVCDGQSVLHVYDELGLIARRDATPLRLAALRQLAPHFVRPADELARRFDVSLENVDKDGFTLRLDPVTKTDEDSNKYQLLLGVGNDGLLRHTTLLVNGKRQLRVAYQVDAGKVSIRWSDKNDKELAKASFVAKRIDTDKFHPEKTFGVDQTDQVVINMPLRRPSYYEQQISQADKNDVALTIQLKRHHALASIQELQWRRWGQANPVAQKSLNEAIELMAKSGQKAKLGDLTLLGSAGVYHVHQLLADKTDVPASHPVRRYFRMRSQGWDDATALRDEHTDTLSGHLAAYYAATQQRENMEPFDAFVTAYPDSPLVLAAAFFRANWGNQPDPWLHLFDQPKWRGMAILMSAARMQTPEHRGQLAAAFEDWYGDLVADGYDIAIPQPVVNVLKQHDVGKLWRTVVQGKFERAKKQERVAPLLQFAENALSWGETELADEAIQLIQQRLGDNDTLVARLALAQAYWVGGRVKDALNLYDEILAELEARQVPASPTLLAATARLAQQAGDTDRAINLEEQALALEHPYLPEMINLQAFRQRYSWLWQQYQAQIQAAAGNNDDQAVSDWLARAKASWQRWFEVDHDNPQMIQQMATLLETAGRTEDAWLYLSTLIDQKPKDAQSYFNVGQWYFGREDLETAQQYYDTAYRWDTANPRWLWERAQALDRLERKDEARKLYRQIVNGKWAPGLQGWVNQAKEALK